MARRLDVRKMVRDMGGPASLHRQLKTAGYSLSLRTIHQWIRRGRISAEWLLAFSELRRQQKRAPLDLQDYATDESTSSDLSFLE